MHSMTSRQGLLLRWLLLALGLVIYGSIFPFEFYSPEKVSWGVLLRGSLLQGRSLGDILGNVALFVPYGFLGTLFALGARQRVLAFVVVVLSGGLLATLSQVFQLFVVARDPALADAVWNLIGMAIGGGVGWAMASSRLELGISGSLGSLPGVLVLLWVLAELVPLVPSIDFQQFKDSLKPLFVDAGFGLGPAVLAGASILLLGECLAVLSGRHRATGWLTLLVALTGVLKLLIVTVILERELVAGWFLGLLSWWLLAGLDPRSRKLSIAWVTVVALIVGALHPFEFSTVPGSFQFVPFAGLLEGSMLQNARSLLSSFFLFVGLLWLLRDQVRNPWWAAAGLASLLLVLEAAQVWIVGRVAALDEPLMALIAAMLAAHWESLTQSAHVTRQTIYAPLAERAIGPPARIRVRPTWRIGGIRSRPVVWIVVVAVGLGVLIYFGLRLPGLPYNVRELFLDDGGIHRTTLFGAAMLWIGLGAYWLGHVTARSRFPALTFPVTAMICGVISLGLASLAVTSESIADIAGSTNLFWFVTNRNLWGETAAALFLRLGPEAVSVIERATRYAALYGPVVGFLGVLIAVRLRICASHGLGGSKAWWFAGTLVGGFAWLLLCKLVAFDYSSTDNLNELIAPSGHYGIGGGGYLYLLLATFSINAVLLSAGWRGVSGWSATLAGSLIALALGWVLLKLGLHPAVEKYGLVFSGVQFLLGPDRQTVLSEEVLFGRWALVYIMGLGVVAVGLRLGQAWGGKPITAVEGEGQRRAG
jgi:VanZ family protein